MLALKRFGHWLAILFTACAAGCLGGYAYPQLSYVPPLQLQEPCGGIHAFRVEVVQVMDDIYHAEDKCVLRPIPLSSTGEIAGQANVSLEAAWGVLMLIPTEWTHHCWHTMRVRLYRPGFQTVEIEPWQAVDRICWKAAADWQAQEKAVDELIASCHFDCCMVPVLVVPASPPERLLGSPPTLWLSHLARGSSSEGQRQSLRFAAEEYERIAVLAASAECSAGHTQLLSSARLLRELADQ
jgi:hypothetical protein